MLFTGIPFFVVFLPVILAGFFLFARVSLQAGLTFLTVASFAFYAVESPVHVPLLVASICFNYFTASQISRFSGDESKRLLALRVGIVVNLLTLMVFKYAGFFVTNINALFGAQIPNPNIALPIGISFFTFTQIAYLVDHYRTRTQPYDFVRYGLFVTYFPHLVAGPIIHHASVMPQLHDPANAKPRETLFCLGFTIFAIGLFKKVIFADGIASYADAGFTAVDGGRSILVEHAWLATSAYALQLYFDFSGYSDMAIGLSFLLGIRLPYNFNSPYQALSISDFWRRWHMTLSAFLRDYLYIALGGNRHGTFKRYRNLLLTMLLGGLWHGASWNFVIWGALHGAFLVVHQNWIALLGARYARWSALPAYKMLAWSLTIVCVLHAWVYFRATTFSGANLMIANLWSASQAPHLDVFSERGLDAVRGAALIVVLGIIVALLPNSNQIGERARSWIEANARSRWVLFGFSFALCCALVLINALRGDVSPFIYFNF